MDLDYTFQRLTNRKDDSPHRLQIPVLTESVNIPRGDQNDCYQPDAKVGFIN